MNEKLEYQSMLEMPISSSTVNVSTTKKKRVKKKVKVNPEKVKEQLLDKINCEQNADEIVLQQPLEKPEEDFDKDQLDIDNSISQSNVLTEHATKKKPKKFSIIGVQLTVICMLALTIILTNALLPNSGINAFFSGVFKAEQVVEKDERTYSDFAPVIAMGDNRGLAISEGVISFGGKGSIYAPCDGVVSALNKDENGKFSIEITHSENFKSYLTGIEYAYVGLNDSVYSNIPVGYLMDDGAEMCFYNGDGTLISGYTLVDGSVVWEA